jgi:hypothetical protein
MNAALERHRVLQRLLLLLLALLGTFMFITDGVLTLSFQLAPFSSSSFPSDSFVLLLLQ